MSISLIKEINLFQEIATAIGGTLEDVCNLQDQERKDLMTVLGLQDVDYNENYQLDSPCYRTRSVTQREVVERTRTVSTEHVEEGEVHENNSTAVAMFIICEVVDKVFVISSRGNNETIDMNYNKIDNENIMMSDLSTTSVSIEASRTWPSTSNNNTGTNKSARGQINKLTRGKKGRKKNSSAQIIFNKDQISPKSTTNKTEPNFSHTQNPPRSTNIMNEPSCSINQIKDVFLQRLYPEYLGSRESSSWCTKYGLHHNILNTDHPPVPVDALLDSQEPALPLLTRERIVNIKCRDRKEGIAELYKMHEVITEMKSKGLVHGRTSGGQEWIKVLEQSVNEDKGCMEDSYKLPLRRSQRKGKMSRIKDDTDYVYGDFIMSSEEEESLARGREKRVAGVETRTPVIVNSVTCNNEEGSYENGRKRGRKRKLFDWRSNFMSDSPGLESVSEEMRNVEETQQKRKSRRSGNGINRTMDMLKQEGSLTDLCKL